MSLTGVRVCHIVPYVDIADTHHSSWGPIDDPCSMRCIACVHPIQAEDDRGHVNAHRSRGVLLEACVALYHHDRTRYSNLLGCRVSHDAKG